MQLRDTEGAVGTVEAVAAAVVEVQLYTVPGHYSLTLALGGGCG